MAKERTKPDPRTKESERAEAEMHAAPDRAPTDEEARRADEQELDPDVREHADEMYEKGAHQKGEGRLP
jgi:hypothetical protein